MFESEFQIGNSGLDLMVELLHDLVSHYGQRVFLDEETYERTLHASLGDKTHQRLQRLIGRRAASPDWEAEYFDFLGHYSRAGICHSMKALTLSALGTSVEKILPRTGRILDLGANIGWQSAYYARKSSNREVVGIDIAKRCIHEASRRAVGRGLSNASFVAVDFFEYLPDDLFQCVVDVQGVCENLPQRKAYFEKVSSVLAPDGRFISVAGRMGNRKGLRTYLDDLRRTNMIPQFVGYHATKDLGKPACYPIVVAQAGGSDAAIDVDALFRRIEVALGFLHWDIFLGALHWEDPPEVGLFIPNEHEEPDRVQEGDIVVDVNGVPIDELTSARSSELYERDQHYLIRFRRSGKVVQIRYD